MSQLHYMYATERDNRPTGPPFTYERYTQVSMVISPRYIFFTNTLNALFFGTGDGTGIATACIWELSSKKYYSGRMCI